MTGRRHASSEVALDSGLPQLRAALAGLSENHREALMLVAWHGLTGARAARVATATPCRTPTRPCSS